MIGHYLKIAWRNILKYKTQSIISVLGLAIGFTAFVLGGYWYQWEHSFDTFHPDWKRTYAVTTGGINKPVDGSYTELNQLHQSAKDDLKAFPEIEASCVIDLVSYGAEGKERSWMGLQVDSSFFDFFTCELISGTYKGNAYDRQSVILTESMALHLFGRTDCVGELYKAYRETVFTIVGVMKDYPANTELKFNYLLLAPPGYDGFNRRLETYVRVKPQVNIAALKKKIDGYKMKVENDKVYTYSDWHIHLRALPEVHIICSPELNTRFRNIRILAVAGLLAFASALMNLLSLFIARQQRKSRYNGTFRTMGASGRDLAYRYLWELLLPLLLAFVLSMVLLEWLYPFYRDYTALEHYGIFDQFVHHLPKARLMKAALILYPLSCILFLSAAMLPVRLLVKTNPSASSGIWKDILIAGQIMVGSLFLVAAIVFYQQYRFTQTSDKGLVTDRIWQINIGFQAAYEKDLNRYIAALKQSPYIEEVTSMTIPVLSSIGDFYCSYITDLDIHREKEGTVDDNVLAVDSNFQHFFGIRMKSGRWLDPASAVKEYVVNETGAKMAGIDDDLLGTIHLDGKKSQEAFRIAGILSDYHYCPLQYPLDKVFFTVLSQKEKAEMYMTTPYIYIKIRPEQEERALTYARQLYTDYEKGEVAPGEQIRYLPDIMEELNASEIKMSRIFLTLAVICILISSVGIYSLVALSTEQRKKEIAIRKINGSKFGDILQLFFRKYLWLNVAGNAVALPAGYYFLHKWLETYAYHVALSGWVFLSVFLITLVIVLIAVAQQVRKAARDNPAEVVKSE